MPKAAWVPCVSKSLSAKPTHALSIQVCEEDGARTRRQTGGRGSKAISRAAGIQTLEGFIRDSRFLLAPTQGFRGGSVTRTRGFQSREGRVADWQAGRRVPPADLCAQGASEVCRGPQAPPAAPGRQRAACLGCTNSLVPSPSPPHPSGHADFAGGAGPGAGGCESAAEQDLLATSMWEVCGPCFENCLFPLPPTQLHGLPSGPSGTSWTHRISGHPLEDASTLAR